MKAFDTVITETADSLAGPWRRPHQMLHAQVYDSHASIHDDATAQKLGFQGGTIEGPTHFSQFAPLCERLWGEAWFETGCISAHYRNPVFRGRGGAGHPGKARSRAKARCAIRMVKRDGTEVLRGTASVGRRRAADRAGPAADRAEAAGRSGDPARRQGRHEDRAPDRPDGFRPEHGRALSVLARRQTQGDHRAEPVYYPQRRRQSLGTADHPDRDAQRAVSVSRRRRIACRSGARRSACSPIRKSGCCAARCSSARTTRPSAKWSR